jgi:hypothetical protein
MKKEVEDSGNGRLSSIHMNYQRSSLEIRETNNKGRGMFTREGIKANELIMAVKAYEFIPSQGRDVSTLQDYLVGDISSDGTHQSKLNSKVIMKLNKFPNTGKDLYSLCRSPTSDVIDYDTNKINIDDIRDIIQHNSYYVKYMNELGVKMEMLTEFLFSPYLLEEYILHSGLGLWIEAAYINHCCTSNCYYFIISDFMFVISNRDIPINEEITISYIDILRLREDYERRKEMLSKWNVTAGFECQCNRCIYTREHPDFMAIEKNIKTTAIMVLDYAEKYGLRPGKVLDRFVNKKTREDWMKHMKQVPIYCQFSLKTLYQWEMGGLLIEDGKDKVLKHFQILKNSIKLEESIFGNHHQLNNSYFTECFSVIACALTLIQIDYAYQELKRSYELHCCPPWGLTSTTEFIREARRVIHEVHHRALSAMIEDIATSRDVYY